MQEINYYKSNEILEHRYYQIPQELFVNPLYKDNLNSDSKLLYGFLLDRLSLSQKNKWYDKDYNVYLIFTREEVGEKLNLSPKTVTKAFKQLIDTYLIEEKRQGLGKPNLIFVGKIQHEDLPSISDTENLPFQSGNIYASEKGNNTVLDKEILPTINPNTIKPNRINTDSINPQRGEEQDYLNRIKIQCNLHEFEKKEQSILEDVIDTLYYSPSLKVGAVIVNHLKILSKLDLITKDNLLQLVQMIDTNSSIKKMTQYLMICLYNNLGNSNIVLKNDIKKMIRNRDEKIENEIIKDLYQNNVSLNKELSKQAKLVDKAERYEKERQSILAENKELNNRCQKLENALDYETYRLENQYNCKINKLEKENNFLRKTIDKLKFVVGNFILWTCDKFSVSSEEQIMRDFYKETNISINPNNKQYDVDRIEQKEKGYDLER